MVTVVTVFWEAGTFSKISSHRHKSGPQAAIPLGERKALLISSVESAFAFTLVKSNRTRRQWRRIPAEKERDDIAQDDQRHGGERFP